jgi:uncharacterized phage protein (TIGR01671 family)
MREILFRGKTEKGKWVEGFYTKGFRYPDEEELHDLIYMFLADEENNEWRFYCEEVIPETVGQFTGLTDKNGKKIFEGDILAQENYEGKLITEGIVEYGAFNCSCCDGVYGWYITEGDIRSLEPPYKYLVVIGNITDNPELLEVQNER